MHQKSLLCVVALAASLTVSSAQMVLFTQNFNGLPDWSGYGTSSSSTSVGTINSVGSTIYPTAGVGGSKAWGINGGLAGGASTGTWFIQGTSPVINLASNPSTNLSQLTLDIFLAPNIYTNQLVSMYLWDGVNFANRLEKNNIYPGFFTNNGGTLNTFSTVGSGLAPNFTSFVISLRIQGQNWTWGSTDGTKQLWADNIQLTTSVPEPSTWALLALGAAGLAWHRRSRRRS